MNPEIESLIKFSENKVLVELFCKNQRDPIIVPINEELWKKSLIHRRYRERFGKLIKVHYEGLHSHHSQIGNKPIFTKDYNLITCKKCLRIINKKEVKEDE